MIKYVDIKRSASIIYINNSDVYSTLQQKDKDNIDEYILRQNIQIKYTDVELTTIINSDKIERFQESIAAYLDSKAQEKGYDNIINASLRAAFPNSPYHAEGVAYGEWMDNVWSYCYQELDRIQQGLRAEPTIDEFILELPKLNL